MREIEVDYVIGDDWQGLFFDGHLVDEGHSISIPNIFLMLEGSVLKSYRVHEADLDWLDEMGSFPVKFEEVEIV